MNFSCDLKLQPRKLRLQPQPASNFFDSASSFCCRHHVHRCGWTWVLKRILLDEINFSYDLKLQPRKLRLQPQPASNFLDSASSFCCRHHVHRCGWTRVLKRDQHDVHRRPHGGHWRRAFKLAPPHRPQGQPSAAFINSPAFNNLNEW